MPELRRNGPCQLVIRQQQGFQVAQLLKIRRDGTRDLVFAEIEIPELYELSQFQRYGSPEVVGLQNELDHLSVGIGRHPMPASQRFVAQPVRAAVPTRSIHAVVKNGQRVVIPSGVGAFVDGRVRNPANPLLEHLDRWSAQLRPFQIQIIKGKFRERMRQGAGKARVEREIQRSKCRNVAQLAGYRSVQVIVFEVEPRDLAITIHGNAVPLVERREARPVRTACPARPAGLLIQRDQGIPLPVRTGGTAPP